MRIFYLVVYAYGNNFGAPAKLQSEWFFSKEDALTIMTQRLSNGCVLLQRFELQIDEKSITYGIDNYVKRFVSTLPKRTFVDFVAYDKMYDHTI